MQNDANNRLLLFVNIENLSLNAGPNGRNPPPKGELVGYFRPIG